MGIHRRGATRLLTSDELAIVGLASGCGLLVSALGRHFVNRDFDLFYASAVNVAHHADPYTGQFASLNTNPPHLVALMMPLSALGLEAAYWLWTAISAASIAASIWLTLRNRQLKVTPPTLAVFLAFSGTFYQLAGGQVAWLLTLPMTCAWLSGPTATAGLLIGACASIKPFLFLFGAYFLWRREWLPMLGLIVGALIAVLSGVAFLGIEAYMSWMRTLKDLNTAFHYSNGALYGIFSRISQPDGLFLITPRSVKTLWIAASLVVFGMMWDRLHRGMDRDREWALVVVTAMLISPLGQPYYLALALGPLWTIARRIEWPRWGLGVLGLFWWPNLLTSPDVPTMPWQLITYSFTVVGLSSLWLVLAFRPLPMLAEGVRPS
jgi:glycosyl transferase family 87